MQARYYDPGIGRFLSKDPVTFMGSGYDPRYFNRYAYSGNDPVNNIDPDGEFTINANLKIRHGRVLGAKADIGIKFDSKNLQLSISPKVSAGLVAGKFQGGAVKIGASSDAPAESSLSAKASADLGVDAQIPLPKALQKPIPGTNVKVKPAISVSQEVGAVDLVLGEVSGPQTVKVEGGVGKGGSIAATVGVEGTANIDLGAIPEKVQSLVDRVSN